MTTRLTRWLTTLDNFEAKMAQLPAVRRYGRLTRATGLVLEATGLQLPLGATLSLHGWRLRGDPTLHPGGCKVSADEGDLDASVATRWQELCRLAAPGVV